jgi:phage terminase large subunit
MIKLNPKYKSLFSTDCRITICTGGRGSAKSFAVSTFLCLLSFEQSQRILYTRQTMTSAHLSVIPEFQQKLEILGVEDKFTVNKTEIINKESGSEILFKGLTSSSGSNTAQLKSLSAISVFVLDEAEESDEQSFDKINLSIRTKGVQNRIILILNPATKEHWIYRRFFEDAGVNSGFNGEHNGVNYIHTDFRDNAHNLDQSFLNEIEAVRITNPKKYNHVILGGWLEKSEGVIFENWRTGQFVDTGYTMFGSDWGFSTDPTTLVRVSVDEKNKKIYLKQELYRTKLTTDDISQILLNVCGNSRIVADSAEPRLITELYHKGLNIKGAIKGPGSIKEGIAVLLNYELIVDPESIDLIRELNNYAWSDKKSETPIDAYNHIIDAVRYACSELLVPVFFTF